MSAADENQNLLFLIVSRYGAVEVCLTYRGEERNVIVDGEELPLPPFDGMVYVVDDEKKLVRTETPGQPIYDRHLESISTTGWPSDEIPEELLEQICQLQKGAGQ